MGEGCSNVAAPNERFSMSVFDQFMASVPVRPVARKSKNVVTIKRVPTDEERYEAWLRGAAMRRYAGRSLGVLGGWSQLVH